MSDNPYFIFGDHPTQSDLWPKQGICDQASWYLAYGCDPTLFSRDLFGIKPDPWQVQVLDESHNRLFLNCSRQSGKSTTSSIKALHKAVFNPGALILLVSPSFRQSQELFKKVLKYLKILPKNFTGKLIEDNKLSVTLWNHSRIVSLPGSPDTIRGFSAPDLIICDEAAQISDDLYDAIVPMLAVSNGTLMMMSTPFGKRGVFYEIWRSESQDWVKIEIKAKDCPRISKKFLTQQRRNMIPQKFSQEFDCEFVDDETTFFSSDLIQSAMCEGESFSFMEQAAA